MLGRANPLNAIGKGNRESSEGGYNSELGTPAWLVARSWIYLLCEHLMQHTMIACASGSADLSESDPVQRGAIRQGQSCIWFSELISVDLGLGLRS
eukprot:1239068-Rhodomonas_salina.1